MPGFATHYLFGVSAIRDSGHPEAQKLIRRHYRAYGLGLQGPDLFFYYLPAFLFRRINPGSTAHNNKTNDFLEALMESGRLFSGKNEKEIAFSYLMGFIGHYTLDTICHPYIYYKSRYDETDKAYYGRHVYLETDIDAKLLRREKYLLPSQFRQDQTIRLKGTERRVVSKCLHYAYKKVFPELKLTYCDMYAATLSMPFGVWFLRDVHGKKKAICRKTEHAILGYPFVSPMIPSDKLHFTTDPLNLARQKWFNPWNTRQISDESFIELFERAKSLYLKRIEELMHTGRLTQLENLSFSSGLPIT